MKRFKKLLEWLDNSFHYFVKSSTMILAFEFEKLRRGRSRAVAYAIARHFRLWLTMVVVILGLFLLHQFPFWRNWTRSDLQNFINELRGWLPADWIVYLKKFGPRFWIPVGVGTAVLMIAVPLVVAFIAVRRHRKEAAHWEFEVHSAREPFLTTIRNLGIQPDSNDFLNQARGYLLKYLAGIDFLLPNVDEFDFHNEGWIKKDAVDMAYGFAILIVSIPDSEPALSEFLSEFARKLPERSEAYYILRSFSYWFYWDNRVVERDGCPPNCERSKELLFREIEDIRRLFSNKDWLMRHNLGASS